MRLILVKTVLKCHWKNRIERKLLLLCTPLLSSSLWLLSRSSPNIIWLLELRLRRSPTTEESGSTSLRFAKVKEKKSPTLQKEQRFVIEVII